MRGLLGTCALCAIVAVPGEASSASLASLLTGGTLTEADLVFDAFSFEDFTDVVGFPNDDPANPDEIAVTTSSTSNTVSLKVESTPGLAITGELAIFDFWLDFAASVAGTSTRSIIGVELGGGDLAATGTAVSEVIYDVKVGSSLLGQIEIFEAPNFSPASQTSDSLGIATLKALSLEGQIEGDTDSDTDMASLSTYTLTFVMDADLPNVIPLPASAFLLLGGLAGLGFAARRRLG
jgi:hypothetical protein